MPDTAPDTAPDTDTAPTKRRRTRTTPEIDPLDRKKPRTMSASTREWDRIADAAEELGRRRHQKVSVSGYLLECALGRADDLLGKG
jgi:hypothetical protein